MTYLALISIILASVIIPWVVQLIKNEAISSKVAGWFAIGLSVAAGLLAGFIGGIPATPEAWLTCILAVVGGVQVSYMAFKAVGITNKWLDALLEVGSDQDQSRQKFKDIDK